MPSLWSVAILIKPWIGPPASTGPTNISSGLLAVVKPLHKSQTHTMPITTATGFRMLCQGPGNTAHTRSQEKQCSRKESTKKHLVQSRRSDTHACSTNPHALHVMMQHSVIQTLAFSVDHNADCRCQARELRAAYVWCQCCAHPAQFSEMLWQKGTTWLSLRDGWLCTAVGTATGRPATRGGGGGGEGGGLH